MAAEKMVRKFAEQIQKASPEERINLMLGMSDRDGERLSSRFTQKQCKLKSIEVLSPTTARAVFAFTIDRFYCNLSDNLHGGAQALFFDICTSLTLQAIGTPGFWINAGVSRVLTVNYLRPAPAGLDVELECEVVQAGRTLSMLRGVLRRASDGVILSTCEHNKAAVEVKPALKL